MASGDDIDKDTLSKLLHTGTVAEYESEFVMLATRVKGMSESLLTYYYIAGLKPLLQCELLRSGLTDLGEAFSLARIIEARFEAIAGKRLNIKDKIDIVLSWPSEDIGVVEVSSAIDDVFDIGESNVESMEVRSEFGEFSETKESVKKVGVSGCDDHELMGYYSYHLEDKVIFEGVGSIMSWGAGGGRRVLWYVQGNGRRKKKKSIGCGSARKEIGDTGMIQSGENFSIKKDGAIQRRLWDPEIKRVFQDITLRAR